MKYLSFFILFVFGFSANATTWNEPWHEDVVKEANVFALFVVEKNDAHGLTLKLIKPLAGDVPDKKLTIKSFYRYNLTSYSSADEEEQFSYKNGEKVYAYLKHKKGVYAVATPTAGIDGFFDAEKIGATYRFSAHKTLVDSKTYEETQICIFNYLHGGKCGDDVIERYISKPLKVGKVGLLSEKASTEQQDLFFSQHVALEMAYLISYSIDLKELEPFLTCSFPHVQISAVRALTRSKGISIENQLADYIVDKRFSDVSKVMAVILLKKFDYKLVENKLVDYLPAASQNSVSIVGDIMDPRVGTFFPDSVKDAIEWLYDKKKE